jgi:hypothetical protein
MKDVSLSKNFKLSEFTKNDVTDYTLSLLKLLASQLQVVRNKLQDYAVDKKKAVSISVNSGVRTEEDYKRLIKNGYNPSKTSDHFCGYQLSSKPTLGAADIKVFNCSLKLQEIANMMIEMNKTGDLVVGQIIFEYNPKTKSSWIHVGNDWKHIFEASFIADNKLFKTRKKYLMSLDNGKTYQTFNLNKINKALR